MPPRALCLLGVAALISLSISACGDSGASQDELDKARKEGAAQARQQAKIESIEKQLKSLRKNGNAPIRSSGSTPSTATSGISNCGGRLTVGQDTTCSFAENVQRDYYAEIGSGAGTVVSYSPVTGNLYSMYCTAGQPHECTGGNDASVYFP
jgi:hypothetical protein